MKIAVSFLSAYLYCQRKLFLSQVLMLEEPPKESMVMGSIKHEFYDKINRKEEEIVKSITKKETLSNLQSIYRQKYRGILLEALLSSKRKLDKLNISVPDAYKKSYQLIAEESSTRAGNVFNFIGATNLLGEELWQRLTPKIISEMRLESDSLKLTGIVDQVHVHGNDYVPYELKTGKAPKEGIWPSHRIQIAAYSLLLQERLGRQIKEGFVFYTDSKEKRNIAINPFMKEEVMQTTNSVIKLLESKEAPELCDNINKCAKCSLSRICHNLYKQGCTAAIRER